MSTPYLGEIRMFAGNYAPRGFAFCNGQILAIAQNDALFALIGTTYGGDGQQTFGLPDLRGRLPISMGQGPGLSNRNVGDAIGTETVTLSAAQLPDHQHAQTASTNVASAAFGPSGAPASSTTTNFYGSGAADLQLATQAVGAAGNGSPHNNIAPYLAMNFIIAIEGIFPSRN